MTHISEMTTEEIRARMNALTAVLNNPQGEEWDSAYEEFFKLDAELQERFRKENMADFEQFYDTFIKGRTIYQIAPEDWEIYSDWHKDIFGYRPRRV